MGGMRGMAVGAGAMLGGAALLGVALAGLGGAVLATLFLGPPLALAGAFFGGLLGRLDWTGPFAPPRLGGLGTIATGMVVIAIFGGLLALYRSIAPPVGP